MQCLLIIIFNIGCRLLILWQIHFMLVLFFPLEHGVIYFINANHSTSTRFYYLWIQWCYIGNVVFSMLTFMLVVSFRPHSIQWRIIFGTYIQHHTFAEFFFLSGVTCNLRAISLSFQRLDCHMIHESICIHIGISPFMKNQII